MALTKITYSPGDVLGSDQVNKIQDAIIDLETNNGSGNSTSIVVGTSTNGHTLNDCDYLCDGVDDNVEIQAALDKARDTIGTVFLLPGSYYINGHIHIDSVTLEGTLHSILHRASAVGYSSTIPAFIVLTTNGKLKNIGVDGQSINFSITGTKVMEILMTDDARLEFVTVNSSTDYDVYVQVGSNNGWSGISGIYNCTFYKIYVTGVSNFQITNNQFSCLYSDQPTVIKNSNQLIITGNTCANETSNSYFNLTNCSNCIFTNNTGLSVTDDGTTNLLVNNIAIDAAMGGSY